MKLPPAPTFQSQRLLIESMERVLVAALRAGRKDPLDRILVEAGFHSSEIERCLAPLKLRLRIREH